jgi:hypothetical protein
MDQLPLLSLVERIDSALARIERATARSDTNLRDLARRHDGLKVAVDEALGEIDALVAKGGR